MAIDRARSGILRRTMRVGILFDAELLRETGGDETSTSIMILKLEI